MWFFTTSTVPESIKNGSPNMDEFGTPKAVFESSSCDMSTFFDDEQMIMCVSFRV
jgi:hypothetical protein